MSNNSFLLKKVAENRIFSVKILEEKNLVFYAEKGDMVISRLNDLEILSSVKIRNVISDIFVIAESNRVIAVTKNSKLLIADLMPLTIRNNFQYPFIDPKHIWADPQCKFIISLDSTGTITSFDIETKNILIKINIGWINPDLSQFDRDGRNLFTFSKKNMFYKIRIGTGEVLSNYNINIENVVRFWVNRAETLLYVLTINKFLKISLTDSRTLFSKELDEAYEIFNADEMHNTIVLGGKNGLVTTIKLEDFELIEKVQICIGDISSIDIAPNGLYYCVGTSIGEIGLFPVHKGIKLEDQLNKYHLDYTFPENEDDDKEGEEGEEGAGSECDQSNEGLGDPDLNKNGIGSNKEKPGSIKEPIYLCPFCGSDVKTTDQTCPNCGAPLYD